MIGLNYTHKKNLKASVGKRLRYTETSLFGPEVKGEGRETVTGVGPSPYIRKWYATVELEDGIIQAVS